MQCIFCKITNKEIPADIVFENEDLMVFKDANPAAPIHYLVVPKEHIQSIAHLEDNHKGILSKLIYIAKQEAKKIDLKGYKLIFNVGKEGGQVIDHLHLHLLGGWNNDKEKAEQKNVHMKV